MEPIGAVVTVVAGFAADCCSGAGAEDTDVARTGSLAGTETWVKDLPYQHLTLQSFGSVVATAGVDGALAVLAGRM